MARGRPRRLRPRRDRPDTQKQQGGQAFVDPLAEEAGMTPMRLVTDKLRSYKAAARQVMPGVEHRSHKGLNNRAENSHLPFRKRERTRQGFRSVGSLQQFVSTFSAVRNLFVPPHSIRSAAQIRARRRQAIAEWNAVALLVA